MIPLLIIAVGLGVALTVYQLSPRAKSRVDTYVQALRSAHAAHQAADGHLSQARVATVTAAHHKQQAEAARQGQRVTPPAPRPAPRPPAPRPPASRPPAPGPVGAPSPSPPPALPPQIPVPAPAQTRPTTTEPAPTEPAAPAVPSTPAEVADAHQEAAEAAADEAIEQVASATEANKEAAQNTAEAATTAQTQPERAAVVDSAAKVDENAKRIAEAKRTLGVGQCGVRTYKRITPRVKDALLAKLRAEGMGISGKNPWNIDTRQYSVRLRALWDPTLSQVKLIVTTGKGTEVIPLVKSVTCQDIWNKIDPIMKEVTGA